MTAVRRTDPTFDHDIAPARPARLRVADLDAVAVAKSPDSEPAQAPEPATVAAGPDREALLAELVRLNRDWLLGYCLRLTGGDRGRAEDVVQETFLRAWRRVDQMTADHGSVHGWLRKVAHNCAVDDHRARQCRPAEVELAEDVDLPSLVVIEETVVARMQVAELLESLPRAQREAVELTVMQDRTAAEAARLLGLPVGTIKSRVFYGLRTLRAKCSASADLPLQQVFQLDDSFAPQVDRAT